MHTRGKQAVMDHIHKFMTLVLVPKFVVLTHCALIGSCYLHGFAVQSSIEL